MSPASSGYPTPTSNLPPASDLSAKPGWYAVTLQNGDAGVVQYNGAILDWQGITPPASDVVGFTYLGQTIGDIATSSGWRTAISKLPAGQAATFASEIDHGALGLLSKPFLLNAKGHPTAGSTDKTASEATNPQSPAGSNPSDGSISLPSLDSSLTAVLKWITTESNWVRVLEYVGGAVAIYLAIKELSQ